MTGAPAPQPPAGPPAGAERLMAAVFQAALNAVAISDEAGHVLTLNPAAEQLFGYAAEALPALYMSDLIARPGEGAARDGRGNILFDLGQRLIIEGRHAGGGTFPAEMAVQRVEDGGRTLFAAYVRDLSAERAAAAALAAQRAQTEQVERMTAMSTLLSGVAHELNNPLAILVAQATLLREKAPTPDVARRAEKIEPAARRAGRIVQSFLALAQQKPPKLVPLDLDAVLDGALELVGYTLRSGGIAVESRRSGGLPPVQGDRDLLVQVLSHLLVDAQARLLGKAEERRIVVTSGLEGGQAVLTIGDNGPPAPDIAGVGIGIGLTLCRSLLGAHAGSMSLETGRDGGRTIRVVLPVGGPASRITAPAKARLAVLVVDDEVEVGESLAELIEILGHRVALETSAAAALDRLAAERFDAVFTDYRMPGLDGLELRRAIAERDGALAGRTVIVTGDTVSTVAGTGRPATDFGPLTLAKPFTAEEVRAALDQVAAR